MMMATRKAGLSGLTLALLLGGCGAAPTAVVPKSETPVLKPIAPPAADDQDGQKVLTTLKTQAPSVLTLAAKSHSWQILPDGTKDYNAADMWIRRPNSRTPFELAAYISQARDKRVERTKMVFDGVRNVKLKTYFLGFLAVRVTLPVDDSRIVDKYHRSLKDTSLDQMLNVVLDPGARTRKIGTFELRGERLQLVEVRSPTSWPDVSKEIYGMSEKTGMPIYRDSYNKAGKVFRHFDVEGLRIGVHFAPGDFSTDG